MSAGFPTRLWSVGLLLIAGAICPSFVGSASQDPSPQARPVPASVDEVARTLASYFPEVQAKILYIQGKDVVLDAGVGAGLSPGMIVHLFRPDAAFMHPITRKELGHYEKDLGRVEIVEASDTIAKGVGFDLSGDARPGDGVRFSSSRIPVAIIVVRREPDKELFRDLRFALEDTGRLDVVDAARVSNAMSEEKLDKAAAPEAVIAAAPRLGSRLGVEYLLLLDTRSDGPGWSVSLISTPRGTRVASLGAILPQTEVVSVNREKERKPPPANSPTPRATPVDRGTPAAASTAAWEKVNVFSLKFSGRFIRIADVDGDGRPEIVTSDGVSIRIYRAGEKDLDLVWEEEPYYKDQEHLWLDAADINGDGAPEIFVTNRRKERLDSYIIEYRNGAFSRVHEHLPLYFRIVRIPGEGDRLVAQRGSRTTAFAGDVYLYSWKKDRYVRDRRLALPKGQTLYGFSYLGNASAPELVSYSEDDHLIIRRADGKRVYRSPERYGGILVGFDQRDPMTPVGDESRRISIKARIENAGEDVILFRNVPMTRFARGLPAYKDGQVMGLQWDRSALRLLWSLPQVDGFIADFAVGQGDETTKPEVAVLILPSVAKSTVEWEDFKNMLRGYSEVLIYTLSEGTL